MFSTQYIRECVIVNCNSRNHPTWVVMWKCTPKLSGLRNIRKQTCFELGDDVFKNSKIGFESGA